MEDAYEAKKKEQEELEKKFIGLSEDDARKLWNGAFRVVKKDGMSYIITCDLRFDRLNVSLKDGLVYKVDIG